ncbi:MAG: ABC transporter substrate-binding protein [Clostridiales bacterium]|nr:ABC transporter substrate-binding protein [Clostridiales bacterium]MDY3745653.1 ABC transporter substrate-binding protein [Lachnospiraceae bacterium]
MKKIGGLRKSIAFLLTMAMSVGMLAGCGGNEKSADTSAKNETAAQSSAEDVAQSLAVPTGELSDETITVALPAEPNSLVPAIIQCGTETNAVIMSLLYETLYKNEYETMEHTDSSLVEKTEQIDDTHFRLTLKQGIKFQNGEDLTTEDVLYTFQQGAQGALKGEYSIYDVENFEVEDDYNIIFATVQPWAQAQDRLGFEMFFIANKEAFEAAGGAGSTVQYLEDAGTGKYKLAEWVPGDHITVTRNENYWNQETLPYYKDIKFVFINDSSARGMAVQSGDVDIAIGLDLANYNVYESDANINAVVLNDNRTAVLFLNSGNGGPLENEKVREAVYWSLDKEALRQVGMSGFGEIQDTMISTKAPVWDGVEPEIYKPDYEKAKALLAEAGYPDGVNLKFRVYAITATISMLQEQLRQGGINVELELAEIPVHFAALAEGDFDMCYSLQQFAYYTEPVRCVDGINYKYSDVMGGTGYKNEEFSKIASRCYAAIDMNERKEAYAELLAHFREHYVSCGLFSSSYLCLTAKNIEGLGLRGMAVVDLTNIYSVNQ